MLVHQFMLFLWFLATILQIVLAYSCYSNKSHRRRPAFAAFIYLEAIISILAIIAYGVSFHSTRATNAYFWTYYASIGISAALTMLVAVEAGKHTFGPRWALPSWVPVRIFGMACTGIALALALDLICAATNGGYLARAMVTTEQGLTIVSLCSFLIVAIYSRKLGISGNERTHNIMRGFVLYLSVFVVTIFIRGSVGSQLAEIAKLSGILAYCSSLIWWNMTLWKQEKLPLRPPIKDVYALAGALAQARKNSIRQNINKATSEQN